MITVTCKTAVAPRRVLEGVGRGDRVVPSKYWRIAMAAHGVGDRTTPGATRIASRPRRAETTETKPAFKTTELIAYVAAVAGVLIAAMIVDESDAGGLGARQAWLYVT